MVFDMPCLWSVKPMIPSISTWIDYSKFSRSIDDKEAHLLLQKCSDPFGDFGKALLSPHLLILAGWRTPVPKNFQRTEGIMELGQIHENITGVPTVLEIEGEYLSSHNFSYLNRFSRVVS